MSTRHQFFKKKKKGKKKRSKKKMSDYEQPVEEEVVVEYRPGLMWTLLTRFDGFCTVLIVVGLFFLLVKALLSLQTKLDAAQAELRATQTQPQSRLESPLRKRGASPSTQRESEQTVSLRRQLQESTVQLRRQEELLAEKSLESERLYSIVQDATDGITRADEAEKAIHTLSEQLTQLASDRAAFVDEVEQLRQQNAQLSSERETLRVSAEDLTERLHDAEEKLASQAHMWDMMVMQQSAARPANPYTTSTPRGSALRSSSLKSGAVTPRGVGIAGIGVRTAEARNVSPAPVHHSPAVSHSAAPSRRTPLRERMTPRGMEMGMRKVCKPGEPISPFWYKKKINRIIQCNEAKSCFGFECTKDLFFLVSIIIQPPIFSPSPETQVSNLPSRVEEDTDAYLDHLDQQIMMFSDMHGR